MYEHAAELGGRRLGEGPKARLRFRPEDVDRVVTCCTGRGSDQAASGVLKPKPTRRRGRSLAQALTCCPFEARNQAPRASQHERVDGQRGAFLEEEARDRSGKCLPHRPSLPLSAVGILVLSRQKDPQLGTRACVAQPE